MALIPDNPTASTLLFPFGISVNGFIPFTVSSILPAKPFINYFF